MTTGLPTSRLINATWSLSAAAASYANINTLLIVGDSNVIDTVQRIRSYEDLDAVGADFGSTAPEYLAAELFFEQQPTPEQLYIGRWARTATPGSLMGADLTTPQQALSNFTAVTAGGFKVQVDAASTPVAVSVKLSTATSLSQVASLISTALTAASIGAVCTWNGSQFVLTSNTTGINSKVSFLTPPATGTDISGLLQGNAASGGYVVAGVAPEAALTAVEALDAVPTYWYSLTWACATMPQDSDYESVAAYIQTTDHLHGVTTGENSAITPRPQVRYRKRVDGCRLRAHLRFLVGKYTLRGGRCHGRSVDDRSRRLGHDANADVEVDHRRGAGRDQRSAG